MREALRTNTPTHEPYDENAPGPFYVEKDYCITCRLPEHEAPNLMGFHDSSSDSNAGSHCYFKKQPTTPEELQRAIAALQVCCCGALRYAGSDESVLRKLREAGLESQCDAL